MAKKGKGKDAGGKDAGAKASEKVGKKASAKAPGKAGKAAADAAAALDALRAKFERKKAQLAEAQAQLRALEAKLSAHAGPSKFAPERFPALPEVAGVRLAAAEAGVRYEGRLDVMLAELAAGSTIAGVFTRSETRAAPVIWTAEQVADLATSGAEGPIAILVNAGNANAFTGDNGLQSVHRLAAATCRTLKIPRRQVMVASTGVIGEPLPAERVTAKLRALAADLAPGAWEPAARAIMTTDTYPKGASAEVEIGGKPVRIAGVAKGSGMIAPDMATMLSFVFTDAAVATPLLQRLLRDLTADSFNAITVDGDTSTSDTVLLGATGASGAPMLESARSEGYAAFRRGLERVLTDLAHQVVRDGEGISKFVTVRVTGAKTKRAARAIGLSIANSPLVKTAWAGEDPNWGRIVMAVGKSGEAADRDALSITYGPYSVASKGWRDPAYDEELLAAYMENDEIEIGVDVGVGPGSATVWTCDMTHGYIAINADYRS